MQYVFQNLSTIWKHFSPQRLRRLNWTRFNWKASNKHKQTLNMSTTYMDRTNTNQKNYRRANLEMGKGEHGFTRPLRDIFTGQTKEIVRPWHQKKLDVPATTNWTEKGTWTYETMKEHNEHIHTVWNTTPETPRINRNRGLQPLKHLSVNFCHWTAYMLLVVPAGLTKTQGYEQQKKSFDTTGDEIWAYSKGNALIDTWVGFEMMLKLGGVANASHEASPGDNAFFFCTNCWKTVWYCAATWCTTFVDIQSYPVASAETPETEFGIMPRTKARMTLQLMGRQNPKKIHIQGHFWHWPKWPATQNPSWQSHRSKCMKSGTVAGLAPSCFERTVAFFFFILARAGGKAQSKSVVHPLVLFGLGTGLKLRIAEPTTTESVSDWMEKTYRKNMKMWQRTVFAMPTHTGKPWLRQGWT